MLKQRKAHALVKLSRSVN